MFGLLSLMGCFLASLRFPPHQEDVPSCERSTPSTMMSQLGLVVRILFPARVAAFDQSRLLSPHPQQAFPWGSLWRSAPMTLVWFLYRFARYTQSSIQRFSEIWLVYQSSDCPSLVGRCLSRMMLSP